MCDCQKPTVNSNTPGGYWYSMPEPENGEAILFEEPGRCSPQINGTGSTDYHSYNFRFFGNGGRYTLAVKHGGGVERFDMGWSYTRLPEILCKLDSNERYLMLYALMRAHQNERRITGERVNGIWRKAFVEGRLKKRKMPGRESVKVWIEG